MMGYIAAALSPISSESFELAGEFYHLFLKVSKWGFVNVLES